MVEGQKGTSENLGRKDRWPSNYGERDHQEQVDERCAARKPAKKIRNVDEQGGRANVRQNTPAKGLRKR